VRRRQNDGGDRCYAPRTSLRGFALSSLRCFACPCLLRGSSSHAASGEANGNEKKRKRTEQKIGKNKANLTLGLYSALRACRAIDFKSSLQSRLTVATIFCSVGTMPCIELTRAGGAAVATGTIAAAAADEGPALVPLASAIFSLSLEVFAGFFSFRFLSFTPGSGPRSFELRTAQARATRAALS